MVEALNYFIGKIKKINVLIAISIIVIILFVGSIATAFLFPIYPDEISMRIWLSRFPYDYPLLSSNLPACTSSFLQPIPVGLFLPGMVDWFIHGQLSSPIHFRMVGLAFLCMLIGFPILYSIYKIRQSQLGDGERNNLKVTIICSAFIFGIFSIGVNPIFLIINRGEQLILFALVGLIIICLICVKNSYAITGFKKILMLLAFYISISLALHAHGKAFFLIPFFSFVGYELMKSLRMNYVGKMAFIGFSILMAYDSYYVFKVAYSCPEIPDFNMAMKTFSIDPFLIFSSPIVFLGKCFESLGEFYRFALSISFNEVSEVNYLPSIPLSKIAKFANIGIWLWLIISTSTLFIYLVRGSFVKSNGAQKINLALLILFICLLISAIFDLTKNWYAGPYLYSSLALVGAIYIVENHSICYSRTSFRKFLIIFALLAALSQSVFINRNLIKFINDFERLGPKVTTFKSGAIEKSLEILANSCKINRSESSGLVLDDVTYLFFQKSKWPISYTFIFGGSDTFLKGYFKKADSDGLLVRCSDQMYKKYGALLQQEGGFCCISKENLKKLP